jgi:hypothetical protein
MLKYGPIIYPNNFKSNRNLSRISNQQNAITISNVSGAGTTSGAGAGAIVESADITEINTKSINSINDSPSPYIVFSGAVTFSNNRNQYIDNNFDLYPLLFTRDMRINNKLINFESDKLKIKTNVLNINSGLPDFDYTGSILDNIISGIHFKIPDKSTATGYYGGLFYMPNSKIEKTAPTSTIYKWTPNKYNYFSNKLKGFFKLQYLPENLNFSTYSNNLDNTYLNMVDNTSNMTNLQIASLGICDGEIVSINNNLTFKLGDGINESKSILEIDSNNLNILNDSNLTFGSKLIIKSNNTNYIEFNSGITKFYSNILLNNSRIDLGKSLTIGTPTDDWLTFNLLDNNINIIKPLNVSNLIINSSIEFSNTPIKFINNLNIIGSNSDDLTNLITLMSFTTSNINLLKDTYANDLIINNSFTLANNANFKFTGIFNFLSSTNINFMNFNANTNAINALLPFYVTNLNVSTECNLQNDIPINFSSKLELKTNNSTTVKFEPTKTSFYNNIIIDKNDPTITFNSDKKLSINNTQVYLDLDKSVNITGINAPSDIIKASLQISNTRAIDFNMTFIPIDKTWIVSGITDISNTISFEFENVCSLGQMSGKLTGTTRSLSSNLFSAYDINLWTNINVNDELDIESNALSPINVNNLGNWSIQSLQIINNEGIYNLRINCIGSITDKVVWAFKLNCLSI